MATPLIQRTPTRAPSTPVQPLRRPLRVVGGSRRALRFGVVLGLALFGVMLAVTAFQTQLAKNQLEVDKTEAAIAEQRDLYDQLRLQSAQLRSPERLTAEAEKLGMGPGANVEFVQVDPAVVAAIEVSTSGLDDEQALPAPDPLEAYGTVKRGVDGTP